MTMGLTEEGQVFFVTIDGRANNRTGATHEETVRWIKEYFAQRGQSVRYALDLDSASSVAIGVMIDNNFHLLNQTARGSDSKLNDTRYYNHIAYLRKIFGSLTIDGGQYGTRETQPITAAMVSAYVDTIKQNNPIAVDKLREHADWLKEREAELRAQHPQGPPEKWLVAYYDLSLDLNDQDNGVVFNVPVHQIPTE